MGPVRPPPVPPLSPPDAVENETSVAFFFVGGLHWGKNMNDDNEGGVLLLLL